MSRDTQKVNLFETDEVCTHKQPNTMQLIGPNYKFTFDEEDIWSIYLNSDYTTEAKFCPKGDLNNCNKEKVLGDWQVMYDSELIVYLKNDLRFLATFRYELRDNVTKSQAPYDVVLKWDQLHVPDDQ